MRARLGTQIIAAVFVTLIGFGAGCGDNSNNSNDNGGGPRPTRTPTPVVSPQRTATPGGGVSPTPQVTATAGAQTRNVTFTANSSASILGFDLRVAYPTAKGSFTGSADAVACSTTAGGVLTKNDQDNGTLILSVANSSNLTFPITINCTFDDTSGGTLAAGDLTATVREVTVLENGQPTGKTDQGSTSQVTVTPTVG